MATSSTTPTATKTPQIILAKNFDPKLLYIDPTPQRNKSGGRYIRLGYGPSKQTLRLQSPELYFPFGLSSFEDDKGLTTNSVEASLRGFDDPNQPAMQTFYKALQAIDDAILTAAEVNSTAWFGKQMPRAFIAEFQRTLVKPPKDPKYAPLFKAKAVKDFKTGEMPKIFDATDKKTVQPLEYIVKGTSGKILVTLPSIYLIGKTFGIGCRLLQMIVMNRPVAEDGCILVPDEDEDSLADDGCLLADDEVAVANADEDGF